MDKMQKLAASPLIITACVGVYGAGVAFDMGLLKAGDGLDHGAPVAPFSSLFVSTSSSDTGSVATSYFVTDFVTGEEKGPIPTPAETLPAFVWPAKGQPDI
jgi:hypothetical protein